MFLTIFCPDDPQVVSVDPAQTTRQQPLSELTWLDTTPDTYYFDLVARYTLPGSATEVAVGITNLTDEPPPFMNNGPNTGSDTDTYRSLGRSWFVNLKQAF